MRSLSEGNGYWSLDVRGATVGQQYKFVVFHAANNPLWRMDPYVRSILHDANGNLNGLIASSAEGYATPGYATSAWNELVIYELHIGTFTEGGGIDGRGAFTSAITKLNYLKDLGINAIEILPLGE